MFDMYNEKWKALENFDFITKPRIVSYKRYYDKNTNAIS